MKVYIVTSGCYSEYTIRAVFLDKKKAEDFISTRNPPEEDEWRDNPCRIEEYDSDGEIPSGLNKYHISIFHSAGSVGYKDSAEIRENHACCFDPYFVRFNDKTSALYGMVLAKSEEHALKIGRDKMAEELAKEQGVS